MFGHDSQVQIKGGWDEKIWIPFIGGAFHPKCVRYDSNLSDFPGRRSVIQRYMGRGSGNDLGPFQIL